MEEGAQSITMKVEPVSFRLRSSVLVQRTCVLLLVFSIFLSLLYSWLSLFFGTPIKLLDDVCSLSLFVLIGFCGVRWTPLFNLLLAFFSAFVLSWVIAGDLQSVYPMLLQLRNFLMPLVGLAFGLCFSDQKGIFNFHKILIFITVILCIIGAIEFLLHFHYQFITYNKWGAVAFIGSNFRIYSLAGHPTDYGYFLILVFCLLFPGFFFDMKNKKSKLASSLVFLLITVNIILTKSFGPITCFGVVVCVGLASLLKSISARQIIKYASAAVAVFVLLFVFMGDRIESKILSNLDASEYSKEATRARSYLLTIPVVLDAPLFGQGPGRFAGWVATKTDSPVHEEFEIDSLGISSLDVFYPHIAGELGLIGTGLWVSILLSLAYRNYRMLKASDDEKTAAISLTVVMASAFLIVAGFWTMIPETMPMMILFWYFVGLSETNIINNKNRGAIYD